MSFRLCAGVMDLTLASLWPLTMMSAMYVNTLVARSWRGGKLEKVRRLIEKFGRAAAGEKIGMANEVGQERDVRFHAADAEFLEAAFHAAGGVEEAQAVGRHLDEQRIIKWRDDRAGKRACRRRGGCPGRSPSDSG